MKFYSALTLLSAASLSGASAFVTPKASKAVFGTTMRESDVEQTEKVLEQAEVAVPASPPAPKMSQSLPWMECSPALDGSLVGDVGFE